VSSYRFTRNNRIVAGVLLVLIIVGQANASLTHYSLFSINPIQISLMLYTVGMVFLLYVIGRR
jgi:hypothetical protein